MVMRRFKVAEESMLPTLKPGEEFVGTTSVRPGPGSIVALPKPGETDFWLVKRVARHQGTRHGELWVESDNRSAEAIDSRTFGPVRSDSVFTLVDELDPVTFDEAIGLLADEDPSLAAALGVHGRPRFWSRPKGFATLVLLILEQQVSIESGAAVYRRILESVGVVSPETMIESGEAGLRGLGVTRQKAGYILSLAMAVEAGEIDLDVAGPRDPDQARQELLALRGVGPWTADAYLLSALGMPDIFPVGDRALQVGVGEVLGLTVIPSEAELEILAEPWRPIRSAAARIVWHAYLDSRGRSEPLHFD